MKLKFLILFLLFSVCQINASEYYGLIVGYNNKGVKVLKGTCRTYPLNTYINVMKRKGLQKYFPDAKLSYVTFKTFDQAQSDDFYVANGIVSVSYYKDPKKLAGYLATLYQTVLTNQKQMIKDKVFTNAAEVEAFTSALLPMIGILETMSENHCASVTWIAKLY